MSAAAVAVAADSAPAVPDMGAGCPIVSGNAPAASGVVAVPEDDGQLSLPMLPRLYPQLREARDAGPAALRASLVELACAELRADKVPVKRITQAAVRARTVGIYERHWPQERGFRGVAPRTLNRDKPVLKVQRTARQMPVLKAKPADRSVTGLGEAELLAIIASYEVRVAELEADVVSAEIAVGVDAVEKMRLGHSDRIRKGKIAAPHSR